MTRLTPVSRWKRRVDVLMMRDYAIGTADAGLSKEEIARYFADGETPEDFVRWFGDKYDLDRRDSFFPVSRPK